MSGALINFRGPEKSAVAAAAEAVARFLDAIGSSDEDSARRKAAAALHQSWNVLVTFQPVNPRPNSTLRQLRVNNHELHVLFARAMAAAADGKPLPADAASVPADSVFLAGRAGHFDRTTDGDEMPLGRPGPWELLRDALIPGSPTLLRRRPSRYRGTFLRDSSLRRWASSMPTGRCRPRCWSCTRGLTGSARCNAAIERMVGTWLGLLLAGLVLTLHPQGLWLVLVIAVLQFTDRDVDRAQLCARSGVHHPNRLTIVSGGRPVTDVGGLLFARGTDTLIGCGLALAVYLVVARRQQAVARTGGGRPRGGRGSRNVAPPCSGSRRPRWRPEPPAVTSRSEPSP